MASQQEAAPTHRQFTMTPPGGRVVALSGQIAMDAHGKLIGPGDAAAQARACFERIGSLLAEAGAGWSDVARLTGYLVDAGDYPAYAAAKAVHYPGAPPAGTVVIVAGLLVPGALMEVEALAVVAPDDPTTAGGR